jgi:RimJ/RimL family protein N-acetyltransferase
MSLRPASATDLPAVLALWTRAEHAMLLPPPDPGEAEDALNAGLLWVWEAEEMLAGFVALAIWNATDGIWGITHFATARPGRGDGRSFLAAVLGELFDRRGIHRLSVDSVPENAAALRLWQRAGFVPEGRFRQCWRRPDGQWTDSLLFGLLARERDPAALD